MRKQARVWRARVESSFAGLVEVEGVLLGIGFFLLFFFFCGESYREMIQLMTLYSRYDFSFLD